MFGKVRTRFGLVAVLITVGLGLMNSCASISVEHEFDPEADFRSYESFDWMPAESRRVSLRARNPMVETRIRDAIAAELRSKGLRPSSSGEPDVRIGYLLVLEDGVDSQTIYEGDAADWRYRTYGPARATTTNKAFTVGTLVIDVFDVDEKALVWRGAAEGQVDQTRSPEDQRERIFDAVQKILRNFPPGG
jgi:hypothetical protein